ncbi:MAG: ABC transporter permease, partial [Devosia sp.]
MTRAMWSAVRTGLLDMRFNFRRFTLIIACLAIGTALIAGVNSVGTSIRAVVERDAATLMGGDVEVSRAERPASDADLAALKPFGRVADVVDTNVSASADTRTAFVDLVAIGPDYPLLGRIDSPELPGDQKPYAFLSARNGVLGALVDPLMLDELHLKVGDTIEIGGTPFEVRGVLHGLPDQTVRGFRLGRPAVITTEGLGKLADRTSPLPGLGTWFRYKVLLDKDDPEAGRAAIEKALNDPTWTLRTAREGLGPMVHYYDLFMSFLVIVGLSSLLVAGVSIWTSTTAYIAAQSAVVAVLRSLGAARSRVFLHFFSQIAAIAVIGVSIGLIVGGGVALGMLPIIADAIGIPLVATLHWQPLLIAALVGLLTAFAFAYPPLQRAQNIKPALLFRTQGLSGASMDWRGFFGSLQCVPLLLAIAALGWLAVLMAGDARLVAAFALVTVLAVVVFRLALAGVGRLADWVSDRPNRLVRYVLHNVSGPGSTAPSVVVSVGLVVAMLITVEALETNLRNEYLGASVFDAPSFVAPDLFDDEVAAISGMQRSGGDIASFTTAPMLRGALSAVNGTPTDKLVPRGPEAAFLLSGEIPMTYRAAMPSTSRLVEGSWWGDDYHGPALVSVHQKLRAGLGLKVGDELTFDIFGDTITARIANFRDYSWQGGIDFLVTFSPGVLESYPTTLLGAVTAAPGREDALERELAQALPDVKFIAIGKTL